MTGRQLEQQPKRAFWKHYYYDYIQSFLAFLVVPEASKFIASTEQTIKDRRITIPLSAKGSGYDYIIATDVSGYISDVEGFLRQSKGALAPDGRVIITQYSALWEPVLRLASLFSLRTAIPEQNWLSRQDLENFSYLAGLEVIKSGTKMLMPIYIPLVSYFFNAILANIWPFTHLGLFHYVLARKPESRGPAKASISIVVPARNEAGTIEKIARELPELGAFTEIIFIEGNSTDNTYAEIERVVREMKGKRKIIYGKQEGKGKGDAVRKGFDMATGDIVTIYDADMTVPAEEMKKFYNAIVENKGDFINGSRLVYPMQKQSMRMLNFFANKFFGMAFSYILGQQIKDTLCGTKVLWRTDYEKIKRNRKFFGDFDPFGDFDLLFGATKLNMKIIDLPVHYRDRVYGTTNISRFKHGWLLLKMTLFAARKIKFI